MSRRSLGTAALFIGVILLLSAAVLCGYNLYTEQRAGMARDALVLALTDIMPSSEPFQAASNQIRGTQADDYGITIATPPQTDPVTEPDSSAGTPPQDAAARELPAVTIDGLDYVGILSIPALELELPVQHQWSYENLRVSPAIYHGSILTDNLVICGHNYSTHFGALRNLSAGDVLRIDAMDGRVFLYQISAMEVVGPMATADVISGQWDLTLFTCTVGGRTRLVIRCDKVG